MKKTILSLLICCCHVFSFAQQENRFIGILNSFWRNQPVLGPRLQDSLWLYKVPAYFFNTDFSYKARPFQKEVLFADRLNVVRLLGGYDHFPGVIQPTASGINPDGTMRRATLNADNQELIQLLSRYDFVFRNPDGSLGFRPALIKARLGPYLENGYESLTIVLDNIPWALVKHAKVGSYGQVAPPDSEEEWYQTVVALCNVLKELLGEKAKDLRFRIGTEMNARERFDGSEDQFIRHYHNTYRAIHSQLPQAQLSLYNISSSSINSIRTQHNVNAFRVIQTLNTSQPDGQKISFPFIAFSRYFYEKSDFRFIVKGVNDIWNYIVDSLEVKGFSREIHEFGPIGDWNAKPQTDNPTAFGNAMTLQVMLDLYSNGIDRLFHWNLLDPFVLNRYETVYLPHGLTWSLSVLDYMAGGKSYQINQMSADRNDSTEFRALLSVFDNKAYLLVNAFNPNQAIDDWRNLRMSIDTSLLPFKVRNIKSASFSNTNSMHYNLRRDAERLKLLQPTVMNQKGVIPRVLNNGFFSDNQKGRELFDVNRRKYEKAWRNAFMLNKFEGTAITTDGELVLSMKMAPPQSTVIVLSGEK